MKNNMLFVGLVVSLLLIFSSCRDKENIFENITGEDISYLESVSEDIDDTSARLMGENIEDFEDCVTITYQEEEGIFPNTITLDFGEGCEGPHGRIRAGQIVIEISDDLTNEGAVLSKTFVDFTVNGMPVEGTKTITNLGLNNDGFPTLSKEGTITITMENGEIATRTVSHTVTQNVGAETETTEDDVFLIEGTSSGINRKGKEYTAIITQGLVRARSCKWITEGIISFTGENKTRTLDFGDGTCDDTATVSRNNGQEREITLRCGNMF